MFRSASLFIGTSFTVAVFTIFATSNVDTIIGIPHKINSMQIILRWLVPAIFHWQIFPKFCTGFGYVVILQKLQSKLGVITLTFLPRSIKVLCNYIKIRVRIHLIQGYIFALLNLWNGTYFQIMIWESLSIYYIYMFAQWKTSSAFLR